MKKTTRVNVNSRKTVCVLRKHSRNHRDFKLPQFMCHSVNSYCEKSGIAENSIYNICGSKSGRDTDKIKESGLLPLTTPDGNVTFEQARLTLECRKLYGQLLSPEHFIDKSLPDKWYGAQGNFHKVYVVEILKVWEK